MDCPSVKTAWKSEAYVVLQILVSPNGDNRAGRQSGHAMGADAGGTGGRVPPVQNSEGDVPPEIAILTDLF